MVASWRVVDVCRGVATWGVVVVWVVDRWVDVVISWRVVDALVVRRWIGVMMVTWMSRVAS